jgi:hypothetical protein
MTILHQCGDRLVKVASNVVEVVTSPTFRRAACRSAIATLGNTFNINSHYINEISVEIRPD